VILGAGRLTTPLNLARRHLQPGQQPNGAMALVFKFYLLDPAWLHRPVGGNPLQSLDPGIFVDTKGNFPLGRRRRGLLIDLANVQVLMCIHRF